MKEKKGISLIVLVITIIIIIMLASMLVINVIDNLAKSKTAAYAQELNEIESAVMAYYYENGGVSIPSVVDNSGEEVKYTLDTMSALQSDGERYNELRTQVSDMEKKAGVADIDKVEFAKLDLKKIDARQAKRGLDKDPSDIYVISKATLNVYFVKGYKIEKKFYFGLNQELSGITKIPMVIQGGNRWK